MKTTKIMLWAVLLCLIAVPSGRVSAADEPSDDVVQTIVGLVSDKDKDLRAVGLQQVREEAKGTAATKRFAALLPKLAPDGQTALIGALADRGDAGARPAVLEMLKSPDAEVRLAAIRALGPLGDVTDVPALTQTFLKGAKAEQPAARESLRRLRGETVNAALVKELQQAAPGDRVELIGLLVARRAVDTVPSLLAAAESDDAAVRTSAMAALGQLARPEQAPQMLDAVLKAKKGPEREAAEKAVMFVCNRIEDPDKRADGLLAALAGRSADEQIVLLSTVGRVGGAPARKLIEAAMAGPDAKRREAAFRALCNWPDAGVAAKLADLVRTGADAEHRTAALRALIRVAALADKRSDADRLELLKKCLGMATRDEERLLVIRRARAVRTVETLRFVLPYLEQPAFAQEACATVVELAHHRNLREPNKAEFDPALDAVIRICKDPKLIDRAKRYKKGQTL